MFVLTSPLFPRALRWQSRLVCYWGCWKNSSCKLHYRHYPLRTLQTACSLPPIINLKLELENPTLKHTKAYYGLIWDPLYQKTYLTLPACNSSVLWKTLMYQHMKVQLRRGRLRCILLLQQEGTRISCASRLFTFSDNWSATLTP